mmetsp:Transcript_29867/g.58365  ORF Transcript_29867/g.58365 Transcript_29867/m.58365 type:complete len:245 (+) Transcript_29867:4946-5680(+)
MSRSKSASSCTRFETTSSSSSMCRMPSRKSLVDPERSSSLCRPPRKKKILPWPVPSRRHFTDRSSIPSRPRLRCSSHTWTATLGFSSSRRQAPRSATCGCTSSPGPPTTWADSSSSPSKRAALWKSFQMDPPRNPSARNSPSRSSSTASSLRPELSLRIRRTQPVRSKASSLCLTGTLASPRSWTRRLSCATATTSRASTLRTRHTSRASSSPELCTALCALQRVRSQPLSHTSTPISGRWSSH